MIFVWGSRLYGKVDEVPGLFYVATKFGHLWYLPLIPMGSQVILRETEQGRQGVPIPLSMKSMMIAWLRAGLVLSAIWSAFGIVGSVLYGSIAGALGGVITAGIAAGLFVLTKRLKFISRCDARRAREIAQKAGFDEHGLQMIEAHFLAMDAARPPLG